MPVYEYTCGDCAQRFDLYVPHRTLSDTVACRHCGGTNVRRLVSTFAMVGAGAGVESAFDAGESADAGGSCGVGGCCGGSCGAL